MRPIDWSKFAHKIYINVPMQKVYDAWATRTNIESWFLRKGEFFMPDGTVRPNDSYVQAGDTYEWFWHGHPDTTVERGKITEANGKDRFQFVFGGAGLVTIDMRQVDNVTEMILTQSEIPADEAGRYNYHVGCSTGWTFYMANIKSILEGGLDLRNKNPNYSNVINS
ncbi:MAG: hypothetical protein K0Q79_2304 [Flavipsychrobacter sp.]|jgi:uncharacterized protein YndB with AHSA1/START domain|nr:hypothetical protein [Flavipsychrobacter sp.]